MTRALSTYNTPTPDTTHSSTLDTRPVSYSSQRVHRPYKRRLAALIARVTPDVLRLHAEGCSNGWIAATLGVAYYRVLLILLEHKKTAHVSPSRSSPEYPHRERVVLVLAKLSLMNHEQRMRILGRDLLPISRLKVGNRDRRGRPCGQKQKATASRNSNP